MPPRPSRRWDRYLERALELSEFQGPPRSLGVALRGGGPSPDSAKRVKFIEFYQYCFNFVQNCRTKKSVTNYRGIDIFTRITCEGRGTAAHFCCRTRTCRTVREGGMC